MLIPSALLLCATFRVGLAAGEPIGLSLSLTPHERVEIHATAGTSFGGGRDRIAALDVAYRLPEAFGLAGPESLIVWFGAGVRYAARPDSTRDDQLGVRVPIGLSYLLSDGHLELYSELSPGLSLTPNRRSTLDGGVGIRVALF